MKVTKKMVKKKSENMNGFTFFKKENMNGFQHDINMRKKIG